MILWWSKLIRDDRWRLIVIAGQVCGNLLSHSVGTIHVQRFLLRSINKGKPNLSVCYLQIDKQGRSFDWWNTRVKSPSAIFQRTFYIWTHYKYLKTIKYWKKTQLNKTKIIKQDTNIPRSFLSTQHVSSGPLIEGVTYLLCFIKSYFLSVTRRCPGHMIEIHSLVTADVYM